MMSESLSVVIRRMVNPTSGVVYRKIVFHYSRGIDPGVNQHAMFLERGIFMCL